jgi:hypothetical protein
VVSETLSQQRQGEHYTGCVRLQLPIEPLMLMLMLMLMLGGWATCGRWVCSAHWRRRSRTVTSCTTTQRAASAPSHRTCLVRPPRTTPFGQSGVGEVAHGDDCTVQQRGAHSSPQRPCFTDSVSRGFAAVVRDTRRGCAVVPPIRAVVCLCTFASLGGWQQHHAGGRTTHAP